ncbi:hypothetical protein [Magnetococcus sp. PR-3]|uniref:hypothetical protein n=1 Tax=Magnetococcus sp. PR-3 TaxID=3120355 RepID=UPI002FCDF0F0
MAGLQLAIMTKTERNTALQQIRDIIGENGGWITHHTLFSNLSATLNFELSSEQIPLFLSALNLAGYTHTVETPAKGHGDIFAQIALTFIHHEPDLKRSVPAFG